ncbi:MAG: envelope biogenesis factor ElyC, partial [bacterium]|nr:envelope biogenesis factor ElyC [bacterium]
HPAPFLLVTSASHISRAVQIVKNLGMSPVPAPTDHKVKRKVQLSPDAFFPSASNLYKTERTFYEYMGIVWAKLK